MFRFGWNGEWWSERVEKSGEDEKSGRSGKSEEGGVSGEWWCEESNG